MPNRIKEFRLTLHKDLENRLTEVSFQAVRDDDSDSPAHRFQLQSKHPGPDLFALAMLRAARWSFEEFGERDELLLFEGPSPTKKSKKTSQVAQKQVQRLARRRTAGPPNDPTADRFLNVIRRDSKWLGEVLLGTKDTLAVKALLRSLLPHPVEHGRCRISLKADRLHPGQIKAYLEQTQSVGLSRKPLSGLDLDTVERQLALQLSKGQYLPAAPPRELKHLRQSGPIPFFPRFSSFQDQEWLLQSYEEHQRAVCLLDPSAEAAFAAAVQWIRDLDQWSDVPDADVFVYYCFPGREISEHQQSAFRAMADWATNNPDAQLKSVLTKLENRKRPAFILIDQVDLLTEMHSAAPGPHAAALRELLTALSTDSQLKKLFVIFTATRNLPSADPIAKAARVRQLDPVDGAASAPAKWSSIAASLPVPAFPGLQEFLAKCDAVACPLPALRIQTSFAVSLFHPLKYTGQPTEKPWEEIDQELLGIPASQLRVLCRLSALEIEAAEKHLELILWAEYPKVKRAQISEMLAELRTAPPHFLEFHGDRWALKPPYRKRLRDRFKADAPQEYYQLHGRLFRYLRRACREQAPPVEASQFGLHVLTIFHGAAAGGWHRQSAWEDCYFKVLSREWEGFIFRKLYQPDLTVYLLKQILAGENFDKFGFSRASATIALHHLSICLRFKDRIQLSYAAAWHASQRYDRTHPILEWPLVVNILQLLHISGELKAGEACFRRLGDMMGSSLGSIPFQLRSLGAQLVAGVAALHAWCRLNKNVARKFLTRGLREARKVGGRSLRLLSGPSKWMHAYLLVEMGDLDEFAESFGMEFTDRGDALTLRELHSGAYYGIMARYWLKRAELEPDKTAKAKALDRSNRALDGFRNANLPERLRIHGQAARAGDSWWSVDAMVTEGQLALAQYDLTQSEEKLDSARHTFEEASALADSRGFGLQLIDCRIGLAEADLRRSQLLGGSEAEACRNSARNHAMLARKHSLRIAYKARWHTIGALLRRL